MAVLYIASIVMALLLGAGFILIWRRILTPEASALFWRSFMETSWTLLRSEELSELARLYKHMIALVARYLGKNLLGLALGLLPMALVLLLLAPTALLMWNAEAEYIEIYPPQAASLSISGGNSARTEEAGRVFHSFEPGATAILRTPSSRIDLADLSAAHGICWTVVYCAIFRTLDFEVTAVTGDPGDGSDYVVVRPSHRDRNFLWPFLSDLEFTFFAAFVLANLITYLWTGRRA